MDPGNPVRIEGDDESAREGGSEADDVQPDIVRVGRIGSTMFEEEEEENSMNRMVVSEAEIKEKRNEKKRSSLRVVEV